MAIVRDGIYLEDNPPARSQFRVGRRDPVKSVIVVHTAESGTDLSGPDAKAEGVASFIRGRSDAGSYHLIGDSDSIIQLIRFDNEAFHDRTGSNRWAIGISLAMNAADWSGLPAARGGHQFIPAG
ncbi:MAG: N-acetylmuramoyl-L-alanine amidase, partial [Actinomycetota bacterium]